MPLNIDSVLESGFSKYTVHTVTLGLFQKFFLVGRNLLLYQCQYAFFLQDLFACWWSTSLVIIAPRTKTKQAWQVSRIFVDVAIIEIDCVNATLLDVCYILTYVSKKVRTYIQASKNHFCNVPKITTLILEIRATWSWYFSYIHLFLGEFF